MKARQEFEYIERQAGTGKPKKLVFLFHGYGLNAGAMQKMADILLEEVPDVLVVMPHAPEPFRMPDASEGAVLQVPRQLIGEDAVIKEGRQWFDISGKSLTDYRDPLYKLAADLNAFIDAYRDYNDLADEDIAIMGFSQGGAVATYTALLRDDPVACLVAHSTVFLGGDSLQSIMPTLFIYGGADEEFDDTVYEGIIERLRSHVPVLETKRFPELSHKTSRESRKATASFIKRHLVS